MRRGLEAWRTAYFRVEACLELSKYLYSVLYHIDGCGWDAGTIVPLVYNPHRINTFANPHDSIVFSQHIMMMMTMMLMNDDILLSKRQ